jgi:hypothetical protein
MKPRFDNISFRATGLHLISTWRLRACGTLGNTGQGKVTRVYQLRQIAVTEVARRRYSIYLNVNSMEKFFHISKVRLDSAKQFS